MKMVNFISKYLFICCLVSLIACNSDDTFLDPSGLIASGDVFIKTKMEETGQVSAIGYYLVANQMLDVVTVKMPGDNGGIVTLTKDPNVADGNVFVYEPAEEDYSAEAIEVGTYTFTVSSAYEEVLNVTVDDELEESALDALVNIDSSFENNTMNVSWDPVVNGEEYLLRLYNLDNELVYVSEVIAGPVYKYSINVASEGWVNGIMPEVNANYRCEVMALLYESEANGDNKGNNIQSIATGSTEVVWAE